MRWRDGWLWLHNSGEGQFGYVDMDKGDNKTFSGLKLDEELAERKMTPRTGLYFIDARNGSIVHSMNFECILTELYDVCVRPGIRQPAATGPASEDIRGPSRSPTSKARAETRARCYSPRGR